jgi:hypothetical protein
MPTVKFEPRPKLRPVIEFEPEPPARPRLPGEPKRPPGVPAPQWSDRRGCWTPQWAFSPETTLERYQAALAFCKEIGMRNGTGYDDHVLARRLLDAWQVGETAGEDMRHLLRAAVGSERIASAAASQTLPGALRDERLARGWADRNTPELPAIEVEELIMGTLKAIARHEPVLRSWN